MEHSDKKYINALLTNDEPLLKELYQKCFGKIKNFVTDNHGTADDAWDLLQEAMLFIFYKIKRQPFILTCPFDAFIYIVCRNLWIKELRKKRLNGVTVSMDEVYTFQGIDNIALAEECNMQQERRKLFLEKLNELGEGCRQLLEQNWSGLHLNEVAVKLNISYAYARKKKTECMAKLVSLMRQSPQYNQLKW
jgi:RNA polymerase sigma factor (sigma-70 family)